MKYKDIIRLKNGLVACGNLKGVKFAYAVAKNSRMTGDIIADLQKTIEEDDGYKAFQKARIKLCEEMALTDEKTGKPKIAPDPMTGQGTYVFEDQAAFDADLESMKESDEHKEAVDRHQDKLDEYKDLLDEGEAEFEAFTVPMPHVPAEITAGQLEAIFEIIAEE